MSKSLGNIIDPFELVKKYGVDAVRYFLLREIPATEDGDFTYEKFKERYNADLANGLGNLSARIITLAKDIGPDCQNPKLKEKTENAQKNCKAALVEFKFNEALISIWDLISFCDELIEKEKPWEVKNQKIIGDLLFALREVAKLLQPFLPETSEKILEQIESKKSEILFPRLN